MNKPTLKERIKYWFDNQMTKSPLALIWLLVCFSVIVIALVSIVVLGLKLNKKGVNAFGVVFQSLSTLINAWMPDYEKKHEGYLVLMSVVAITGLLFTSVLIGIVSSVIEEKNQ